MSALMDLVAGDAREILLAHRGRRLGRRSTIGRGSTPTSSLGGGLDPTWLDLFTEAVRTVTGGDEPDATSSMPGASSTGRASWPSGRSSGSIRPGSARSPGSRDHDVDAVAGPLDRPRRGGAGRPAARGEAVDPAAAGEIVRFARAADRSPRRPLRLVALRPRDAAEFARAQ